MCLESIIIIPTIIIVIITTASATAIIINSIIISNISNHYDAILQLSKNLHHINKTQNAEGSLLIIAISSYLYTLQ